MRAFRSEKNIRIRIREMLMDAEFLEEKMLFEQSAKVLLRASRLAEQYELKLFQLEINDHLRWVVKEKEAKKDAGAIAELVRKNDEVTRQLLNEQSYFELFDRVMLLQARELSLRNNSQQEAIESLLNEQILSSPDKALGFQAKHFYTLIHGFANQLLGQDDEALPYFEAARKHWETSPHQMKLSPRKYQRILVILLHGYWLKGDMSRFPEVLEKLRNSSTRSNHQDFSLRRELYFYEQLYFLNTHRFEEGLQSIYRVRKFLKEAGTQLTFPWIIGFLYNSLILAFLSGELKLTGRLVNEIYNLERSHKRKDVQRSIRLFRLILAYEQEDLERLGHLYRSTRKYFRDGDMLLPFEESFFNCFHQILNQPTGAHQNIFQECLETLTPVAEKKGSPSGAKEIIFWLHSKVSGRSIRQVIADMT